MKRMFAISHLLTCLLLLGACESNKLQVTRDVNATAESFKLVLKKGMSFQEVKRNFGNPVKDVGSGLHIFVYEIDNGLSVWLGFADLNALMYAKVVNKKGDTLSDLVK